MGTGANREVVPSVVEGRQRIGGAKSGRCSDPTNCGTTVVIMAEVLRFGEILSNIVDCLNQAVDSLTPFSNLTPANTSAVNAGLGRPRRRWPWRRGWLDWPRTLPDHTASVYSARYKPSAAETTTDPITSTDLEWVAKAGAVAQFA